MPLFLSCDRTKPAAIPIFGMQSRSFQNLLAKNLDIEIKPHQTTMICGLTEDSDQPVPKGLVILGSLHGKSF